jgi:hypothetical protein
MVRAGVKPGRRDGTEHMPGGPGSGKVYVEYTYTTQGDLEFDAGEWGNALSHEREELLENAIRDQLESVIDNIMENVAYSVTSQAELDALAAVNEIREEAEAIEWAMRAYAGIEEDDPWPAGVLRPMPLDSYIADHEGERYAVLRRGESIVAVVQHVNGDFWEQVSEYPEEFGKQEQESSK